MPRLLRPLLVVVLMFTMFVPLASAQDDEQENPIIIQGTPELETLVGAIRDAYVAQYPSIEVQLDPASGQRGAFTALCNGETDIVMSTDPIEDSQITVCNNKGVEFVELLLAYEAVVMLATPEAEVDCVEREALNNAWQLGAPEEVLWSEMGSTVLDTPVAFYGPEDTTSTYRLFRTMVPAGDLRENIVTAPDVASVVEKVAEDGSSALGFLSLAAYENVNLDSKTLPVLVEDDEANCIYPSVNTLEDGSYPLSRASYLYVRADSAERSDVRSFLQFALSDEAGAQAIVPELGYTAPLADSYEYGLNNLVGGVLGRTFTRPTTPVSISTADVGEVLVVGAPALTEIIAPINSEFQTRYLNANIEIDTLGNSIGWGAFCAGEGDVMLATRAPSEDEQALCEENGIETFEIDLGSDALITAVPTGNDWLTCLDGPTADALLRAGTEETPATALWSEINEDWPDVPVLAVVPPLSTGETDLLVYNVIDDLSFAVRADAVVDDDPLFRAQGVANTSAGEDPLNNGFTYLRWSDFYSSSAELNLLGVGDECVVPDAETITSGEYPLSYSMRIYFSKASFDNAMLRAFLWHFYDETSLAELWQYDFEGLDVYQLEDQSNAVFTMLADYEDALAAEAPADEGDEIGATDEGDEAVAEDDAEAPADEGDDAEVTDEAAVEDDAEAADEGDEAAAADDAEAPADEAEATDEADAGSEADEAPADEGEESAE